MSHLLVPSVYVLGMGFGANFRSASISAVLKLTNGDVTLPSLDKPDPRLVLLTNTCYTS